MPFELHPDKLVGVARAITDGHKTFPTAPSGPRPVEPPKGPALTPGARQERVAQAPGLLEHMAFALRDRHWNNHLNRLFGGEQLVRGGRVGNGGQGPQTSFGLSPEHAGPAPAPTPHGDYPQPPQKGEQGPLHGQPRPVKPPIPFIQLHIAHPNQ